MCNCLYCYRPLLSGEKDMHAACIKKFFGTTAMPSLDYTTEQLDQLAIKIIQDQTSQYENMPEVEDLTMHLAEAARINVVPHTLMRMADNTLLLVNR